MRRICRRGIVPGTSARDGTNVARLTFGRRHRQDRRHASTSRAFTQST